MNHEEEALRLKTNDFLEKNIFKGLENINDGFDSESIFYFTAVDFEIVLDRIEKYGIGIFGIEPWLNGEFYDVLSYKDFSRDPADSKWYRKAFLSLKINGSKFQYAASYDVPEKLLSQ